MLLEKTNTGDSETRVPLLL